MIFRAKPPRFAVIWWSLLQLNLFTAQITHALTAGACVHCRAAASVVGALASIDLDYALHPASTHVSALVAASSGALA